MNHSPRRRFWRGAAAHGGKATLFCAYYTIATDICKPFFPFPAGKICPKIRAKNPKKPAISAKARRIPAAAGSASGQGAGQKNTARNSLQAALFKMPGAAGAFPLFKYCPEFTPGSISKEQSKRESLPMLTAPLSFSQSTRCNKQDGPRGDGREQWPPCRSWRRRQ